jgi:hypothetical protein
VTGGTAQATHYEDRSGDVAFPPFSREDSVSACGIVEIVPSRKTDQTGFIDPKLPPYQRGWHVSDTGVGHLP